MFFKSEKLNTTFLAVLLIGFIFVGWQNLSNKNINADVFVFDEQEATVRAIEKVRPAVVSVIVYAYDDFVAIDAPSGIQEIQKYRKLKQKGTGFLISSDGYIITNRHVVESSGDDGEYRIILNSGKEYYAQLIDKDRLHDLAVLKIFDKDLPFVELGNSDDLKVGMTVIAIGNALGQYENSATKGIVSALGRSVIASDILGRSATLDNLIQTDAKINVGNSGGPLLDLNGKVVAINTAVEASGSAIGFAIPINDVRNVVKSIQDNGRIMRPRLGLTYQMLGPQIAQDNNLSRDSGAWITSGNLDTLSILLDSPAEKAGLLDGDIIFEVNAVELEGRNTLLSAIQKYKVGDRIGFKVARGEKILIITLVLDELR